MHPRPCGPTPKWGVGKLTWDGESATPGWVDEEGNRRPADQRAQDKRSRRKKTKAQKERAAKTERARKKRLKEDEEKERRMQQELETPTPAGGAEGQPLDGGPPGAGAPKKQKLERKNGYDTNNDLNQLLTQCLICPVKDRTRGAILGAVISAITYVQVHCDMDNYREAEVDGHSVVSALLLVRDELQGKDLEAPRLSYTDNLKIRVRDVLLSPLGKETVRAMVKKARKAGPEAEESKAGLKQEVSEPEEESKVPKEEMMSLVEKLQKENAALMHLLEFERQQKEMFRELYIQSQHSKVPEPATQTGPETNPFDNLPGAAPPLSPLPMPPLSPLPMPPPPSPAVFPQPGLPAAVFPQPGLNYDACWGVPDRAAESNAAADEVDFFV